MEDNWRDWLSNKELFNKVHNEFCKLDEKRLDKFSDNILEKYKGENTGMEWFYIDIANSLKVLNNSFRYLKDNEYVWVIDCWENDGVFFPDREDFIKCIKRIERWTEVEF